MYIQTEFGLTKVSSVTTETILLNFYGEGKHETLSNALAQKEQSDPNDHIDIDTFLTEQASVYWQ